MKKRKSNLITIIVVILIILALIFIILFLNNQISGFATKSSKAEIKSPSSLIITKTLDNQINLQWQDNSNNEQGFIIEGRQRKPNTRFNEIGRTGPNEIIFTAKNLSASNEYDFRVKAYSGGNYKYANKVKTKTAVRCDAGQLIGDLNNDGNISSAEIRQVKRFASGLDDILKPANLCCIDAHKDGIIDNNDLMQLKDYVTGKKQPEYCSSTIPDETVGQSPELAFNLIDWFKALFGKKAQLSPCTEIDITGDQIWDANDLSIVRTNFGSSCHSSACGDIIVDGLVDANDLSIARANFGSCAQPLPTERSWPGPYSLTASFLSPTQIILQWQYHNWYGKEERFIIERSKSFSFNPVEKTFSVGPEARSFIDSPEPILGTTYYYRVKAFNRAGDSPKEIESISFGPPNAPSDPKVIGVSQDSIVFSWVDNSNNEEEFIIERSNSATSGYTEIGRTSRNAWSFSDTGNLNPSTTYYYKVRAKNSFGESSTVQASGSTLQAPGNLIWAKAIGGDFEEWGRVAGVASNGDIILIGEFMSDIVDFGGQGIPEQILTYPDVGQNSFIARYSSSGNLVWVKPTEIVLSEIMDMEVSSSGAIALLEDKFDEASSIDGIFATKYSPSGLLVWSKPVSGVEEVRAIAIDSNENVYTTGSMLDAAQFCLNAFVDKYNALNGNLAWRKSIDGTTNVPDSCVDDEGRDISIVSNKIFITGYASYERETVDDYFWRNDLLIAEYSQTGTRTEKKTFIDPTGSDSAIGHKILAYNGGDDYWVIAEDGNVELNLFDGSNWIPISDKIMFEINDFAVDNDGSAILAWDGYYGFMAKYSPTGTIIWSMPPSDIVGLSADIDKTSSPNNIIIGSEFSDQLTINGQTITSNDGSGDILLMKLGP